MSNPLFPLNEYIPDGEPHVFGDRVYLYGSHDKANGDRFCMDDYVVYSADVKGLRTWKNHGVSYKKIQDPRSTKEKPVDFYAPDCVRGNDGRYYLYYAAMGPNVRPFGPMSVAVSDCPEGPFTYLHDICNEDGSPLLQYLTNDPAVLNDNGRIYLYYGWGLGRDFRNFLMKPIYLLVEHLLFKRSIREILKTKPSILSCAVAELQDDMYTLKGSPKAVLDSKTTASKGSELYHHAFYEAPSIRKFGDLYYLVYSSGENCELAYATSSFPDRDFVYRGVIVSNADLGFEGNTQYKMMGGTIHGSLERISGEYYVFYHRCTNNTDFSRQACAEKIEIQNDGTIHQVEITTSGCDKEPLEAKGRYSAALCCNLYNKKTGRVMGYGHNRDVPCILEENGEHFVGSVDMNTVVGFKYFSFQSVQSVSVTVRGSSGFFAVLTSDEALKEYMLDGVKDDTTVIRLSESNAWQTFECQTLVEKEKAPLYFVFYGEGKIDFLEFEFR